MVSVVFFKSRLYCPSGQCCVVSDWTDQEYCPSGQCCVVSDWTDREYCPSGQWSVVLFQTGLTRSIVQVVSGVLCCFRLD